MKVHVFPPFFCQWLNELVVSKGTIRRITFEMYELDHKTDASKYCAIKRSVEENENHTFPDYYDTFSCHIYRYRMIADFVQELNTPVISLARLLLIYHRYSEYQHFV